MINKIKNIGRRGISLALVLSMIMPTGVHAGTHTVNNWDEYRDKLVNDIMKQEKNIIINFTGSEIFSTEDTARLKITSIYEETMSEIPSQYGILNINKEKRTPVIEKISGNSHRLKEVKHEIDYFNDFKLINNTLVEMYEDINGQLTSYDKIKKAYDYILKNLEYESGSNNHVILSSLNGTEKVSAESYAMLFSIIMDKLGYENIVVFGTIKKSEENHVWNLVKVQGNWYHVDSRLAAINSSNRDTFFLTSDEIMKEEDNYKHSWDEEKYKDYKATGKYEVSESLNYEIAFIHDGITDSEGELTKLKEDVENIESSEDIKLIEGKYVIIKEKIIGHKNSIEALENSNDVNEENLNDLKGHFQNLIIQEQKLLKKIAEKSIEIAKMTMLSNDINAAKQAVDRLDDGNDKVSLSDEITKLEVAVSTAIIAVEDAEKTSIQNKGVLAEDVKEAAEIAIKVLEKINKESEVYKDLKSRLTEVIDIYVAKQEVDQAESKLMIQDGAVDEEVNIAVDEAAQDAEGAKNRVDTLKDGVIKRELNSIIMEIDRVKSAKDEIMNGEVTTTKENIETAKNAVKQVNAKYVNIKRNLDDRLTNLEEKIKNTEAEEINRIAIYAVDTAETIMGRILDDDGDITEKIKDTEDAIKIAKTEVQKIKDSTVKANQNNRIRDIELVIAAIKAVIKAETATPLKMTNVTSARKGIEKIKAEYEEIINKLNQRIGIIEQSIKAVDAEKLIEKAENSLKRTDYNKAKVAVEELKDIGADDEQSDKYKELNNRIIDVNHVITAKEVVEKAEKLMKSNKETVDIYDGGVKEAEEAYNNITGEKFNDKYKLIIEDLGNRIEGMNKTIVAIKDVDATEVIYQGYLKGENTVEKLNELITRSEKSISNIDDTNPNLKGIKKSLQNRLKVFSDGLTADVDYNRVSKSLADIEADLVDNLSKEDNELNEAIRSLEGAIEIIGEESKKIKVKNRSNEIKARITEINYAIAATKAVVKAEGKDEKTIAKDITAASKAIDKLSTTGIYVKIVGIEDFKTALQARISILSADIETSTNEKNAKTAVEKAINTMKEKDINAAIDFVSKLEDGQTKSDLNKKIEKEIILQLLSDADAKVITTIRSIERNDKSVSKNVTEVKKAVLLAENVALLANNKLLITGDDSETNFADKIEGLNEDIIIIDISVNALKTVQQAEKTRKQEDVAIAYTAINRIAEISRYEAMKAELSRRIAAIENDLVEEATNILNAETAVSAAEAKLKVKTEENGTKVIGEPDNSEIQEALRLIQRVTDKNIRSNLQKRIDAVQVAKDAILAVMRAEAYPNDKSVKDAESILSKVDGRYSDIIQYLNTRIAELRNQLDISKKVEEATKLVERAINSRTTTDIARARMAVDALEQLDNNAWIRLNKILGDLEDSIGQEAEDEGTALLAAREAIDTAFAEIDITNKYVIQIIEGEEGEANKIQEAYEMIESAKLEIIKANAAVRKLSDQKALLAEIDYANREIDLAEDNIDVKEAIRLVTLASGSVLNAITEPEKSQARLDIAAARRAIDKINHNKNKEIKTTILNTINAIEKKLESDNDQELIGLAVDAVNAAAEALAKAVREGTVMEDQEQIDKAIFAAKMAISWISDNNKAAKTTLTNFLKDIEALYKAEKDGILNEERIKNAEKAVELAESKKGSDDLENYIRSARLRVRMIHNDGPETEAKIMDFNTRLDALEGKNSGGSGNGNGSGSGGNNSGGSGGNKKPGDNNSDINKVPTSPKPDNERYLDITSPIWGKTNTLKNTNPTTGLSAREMALLRIQESNENIIHVSNILKSIEKPKIKLAVRGKNIDLDSNSYIHDRVYDRILLPANRLGNELGFMSSLTDSKVIHGSKRLEINAIVDGVKKSIVMDIGESFCYIDGKRTNLNSRPTLQDGKAYIPLDFIVRHLNISFSYARDNENIQLIIN